MTALEQDGEAMDHEMTGHTADLIVWLDEQALIASFHAVEQYRRCDFHTREYFMRFLQSLQQQGYRFQ